MFLLMREGGPAMLPLFLCSLCAVFVVIDRALYLWHSRCPREEMMEKLQDAVREGGLSEAVEVLHEYRGPVMRVVRHALASLDGATPLELQSAVERMKALQQALLERRVYLLGTVAAVAPFIGLYGTVVGIQRAFHQIAQSGKAGIDVVGASVSEALIATGCGLAIAIAAVVAYNVLNNLIDHTALEMDLAGDEILSLLEANRRV